PRLGDRIPETRDDAPAEWNYKAYGGGKAVPRPSGLPPGGRADVGSFAQIASLEGADRTACLLRDRHGAAHRDVDQNDGLGRRHHELVVGKADGDALVGRAGAADAADADETLDQVVEAGRRVVLDARSAHRELRAVHPEAAEVTVVLRSRVVEVRQVAAVVDDALRVRVREPDARQRRILERRASARDAPELQARLSAQTGPPLIVVSGSLTWNSLARTSLMPKPSSREVCSSTYASADSSSSKR